MALPNVKIISKESIKPSSPTSNNLRNVKLSLLDQLAPPIFVPLIFFYEQGQLNISQLLKQSLSNILTIFYPLGGRLNQEQSSIDCNDAGANYIEAQVHARLSEITQDPEMEQLKQFLPVQPLDQFEKSILSVKVSFFDCGGIAIGVCLSHKIADGSSVVAFINAWASMCRGEEVVNVIQPSFDFALHYPARDFSCGSGHVISNIGIIREKITTKRFVFDKEKLDNIKQFASSEELKSPTRVETVSAFILHNVMKSKDATIKTVFAAVHAVNLRQRSIPPLSEHAFGNSWSHALALLSEQEDTSISGCAKKLRAAIRKIDNHLIKQVQNGEYLNRHTKSADLYSSGKIEFFNFSSWCRFPVYDVDFGWGKPVWVCPTTLPFKNLVILISTPCGEGIEAWVNLIEEDMNLFDTIVTTTTTTA
ncbi:hypothetical protein RD792_011726 [Penstemon davidsonii]|uniref:Vinorine synthase-like n=1 Tax=Penstemon davidsonii TaxID=160366 RepID=A0ABR0CUV9_9LAMI|nr:hypothetical protein RD792_011726 [Penstemon davidsonii]